MKILQVLFWLPIRIFDWHLVGIGKTRTTTAMMVILNEEFWVMMVSWGDISLQKSLRQKVAVQKCFPKFLGREWLVHFWLGDCIICCIGISSKDIVKVTKWIDSKLDKYLTASPVNQSVHYFFKGQCYT